MFFFKTVQNTNTLNRNYIIFSGGVCEPVSFPEQSNTIAKVKMY